MNALNGMLYRGRFKPRLADFRSRGLNFSLFQSPSLQVGNAESQNFKLVFGGMAGLVPMSSGSFPKQTGYDLLQGPLLSPCPSQE